MDSPYQSIIISDEEDDPPPAFPDIAKVSDVRVSDVQVSNVDTSDDLKQEEAPVSVAASTPPVVDPGRSGLGEQSPCRVCGEEKSITGPHTCFSPALRKRGKKRTLARNEDDHYMCANCDYTSERYQNVYQHAKGKGHRIKKESCDGVEDRMSKEKPYVGQTGRLSSESTAQETEESDEVNGNEPRGNARAGSMDVDGEDTDDKEIVPLVLDSDDEEMDDDTGFDKTENMFPVHDEAVPAANGNTRSGFVIPVRKPRIVEKCPKDPNSPAPMKLSSGFYLCNFCQYKSCISRSVVLHQWTHTGFKPYKCETCNKSFSYKNHKCSGGKGNAGIKPTRKPTRTEARGRKPLSVEPGVYRCNYCPFESKYQQSVRLHQHRHTGYHPFKCEVCGKGFRQKSLIKRHQLCCNQNSISHDTEEIGAKASASEGMISSTSDTETSQEVRKEIRITGTVSEMNLQEATLPIMETAVVASTSPIVIAPPEAMDTEEEDEEDISSVTDIPQVVGSSPPSGVPFVIDLDDTDKNLPGNGPSPTSDCEPQLADHQSFPAVPSTPNEQSMPSPPKGKISEVRGASSKEGPVSSTPLSLSSEQLQGKGDDASIIARPKEVGQRNAPARSSPEGMEQSGGSNANLDERATKADISRSGSSSSRDTLVIPDETSKDAQRASTAGVSRPPANPTLGQMKPIATQQSMPVQPKGAVNELGKTISDLFRCKLCGIYFDEQTMYRSHMKYHGPTVGNCSICHKMFKSPISFMEHLHCVDECITFASKRGPRHLQNYTDDIGERPIVTRVRGSPGRRARGQSSVARGRGSFRDGNHNSSSNHSPSFSPGPPNPNRWNSSPGAPAPRQAAPVNANVTRQNISLPAITPDVRQRVASQVRHMSPVGSANQNVRHMSPVGSANQNVRHRSPVSSANQNVRHRSPVGSANQNVRHMTPVIAVNQNVRHSSPKTAASQSNPQPPNRPAHPSAKKDVIVID